MSDKHKGKKPKSKAFKSDMPIVTEDTLESDIEHQVELIQDHISEMYLTERNVVRCSILRKAIDNLKGIPSMALELAQLRESKEESVKLIAELQQQLKDADIKLGMVETSGELEQLRSERDRLKLRKNIVVTSEAWRQQAVAAETLITDIETRLRQVNQFISDKEWRLTENNAMAVYNTLSDLIAKAEKKPTS